MAESDEKQAFYASTQPLPSYSDTSRWSPQSTSQRLRLNAVAISLAMFLPWAIFVITFTALIFDLRYREPVVAYMMVASTALLVVAFGGMTASHAQRKMMRDPRAEPKWYMFIFVTSLVWWILAVYGGNSVYNQFTRPFYNIGSLNSYLAVDPARIRGQMMMDAAQVTFAEGSHLDLSKAVGFRSGSTYCVVPIVLGDMDHHDFWAVGTDCCATRGPAAYHCGASGNPAAAAGLRLMHDEQRPFYRLAVQQAEAAYGILAPHPLFFYWTQDPSKDADAYHSEGTRACFCGVLLVFLVQLFLVVVALLAFAKLAR